MSQVCHILIGPPSSGKSTLAHKMVAISPQLQIISTDRIRESLFGDESIQGNWHLIEQEVVTQISTHIAAGRPIIYDATNACRAWRIDLFNQLSQFTDIDWIGWHLTASLDTCKTWNNKRNRKVPEEVIDRYYQFLRRFPPLAAEGFTKIIEIDHAKFNQLPSLLNSQIQRSSTNRQNRYSSSEFHLYSQLVDFDRLMYLIGLLVKYPGLGLFHRNNPELLTNILGKNYLISNSIEEVSQVMAKTISPVYVIPEALESDLNWLEEIGIIGDNYSNTVIETVEVDLVPHPYSDKTTFSRLINTIKFILRHPLGLGKEEESTALNSLISQMHAQNINQGESLASLRKDIQKVLKPFGILPDTPAKQGYFIGTSILSQREMIQVFRYLESQAASLTDPILLSTYTKFKDRLQSSHLGNQTLYPVRAIYNRSLTDPELVSSNSLARHLDILEGAIESGKLVEFATVSGAPVHPDQVNNRFTKAYPIQLVFHNVGWYLGFEYASGETKGLFKFQRIERLLLSVVESYQQRTVKERDKALEHLKFLYENCGGIFLGNSLKDQKLFLNPDTRHQVEITIEVWFDNHIFPFIIESNRRFQKVKMSPDPQGRFKKNPRLSLPPTEDPNFPHRFQVTLPNWCINDFDLLRWIVGFGGMVKVVSPHEFVEIVKNHGDQISSLYVTKSIDKAD